GPPSAGRPHAPRGPRAPCPRRRRRPPRSGPRPRPPHRAGRTPRRAPARGRAPTRPRRRRAARDRRRSRSGGHPSRRRPRGSASRHASRGRRPCPTRGGSGGPRRGRRSRRPCDRRVPRAPRRRRPGRAASRPRRAGAGTPGRGAPPRRGHRPGAASPEHPNAGYGARVKWSRLLLALGALAVLTGCAQPVTVPVAPEAHLPDCARIVLALPNQLAGLERRQTSSQATRAWGTEEVITLRCGVEPPAPTTETCTTADDLQGNAVDWVAIEGEDG